jgi:hypothetical protein
VLHPPRARVDLLELALRLGANGARVVVQDSAGAGGALIEREDVFQ